MRTKHLYSTLTLVLLIFVVTIAIFTNGFDIGDDSDCPDGYIAYTDGGEWVCARDEDIETNDVMYFYLKNSNQQTVNWTINDSDEYNYTFYTVEDHVIMPLGGELV